MKSLRPLLVLLLLSVSLPLQAQVTYVRDVAIPENINVILPVVRAPIDQTDPSYSPNSYPASAPGELIMTTGAFYFLTPSTGAVSTPIGLPTSLKVFGGSLVSMFGLGTSSPQTIIYGPRRTLYEMSFAGPAPVVTNSPGVQLPMGSLRSLAAPNRTSLSAIGDGGFYTIDKTTGTPTAIVTFSGGTAAGEFSLDTAYHAYGPDRLVYLLDFGNSRIQALDPEDGFSLVRAFDFAEGATTANMQFVIGDNGDLYLGDGLGGGSAYSATGEFLGSFGLPDGYVNTGTAHPGGASYLTVDDDGHVYVFDTTGFHQYTTSQVPEPTTYAAMSGVLALGFAMSRRRRL